MKPHPLADLIPPMDDEDYAKLRDDIKENGLLEPITLYEGMILDGRHRYQVCGELAIDCPTRDYNGDTPAQYVISLNVNRRHLTTTQRTAIALAAVPHYEKEARGRQSAAGGDHRSVPIGTERFANSPTKRATAEAAADVGVSGRQVDRLKRVKAKAPDLYEKVVEGEVKISAADTIIQKRDESIVRRRRDTEKPYEITSERSRINAEAAKRRLEAVLAALSGHATGLKGFDTPRAMAVATRDELRGWVETLDEAIREFRGLRSTIKEGVSNGIEERSEHRADTSQPVEHLRASAAQAADKGTSQADGG